MYALMWVILQNHTRHDLAYVVCDQTLVSYCTEKLWRLGADSLIKGHVLNSDCDCRKLQQTCLHLG